MLKQRQRVAVVYGSRSVEHEVSIITAMQVMGALDKGKYDIMPVYITPDGTWHSTPSLYTGDAKADIRAHVELAKSSPTQGTVVLPADPSIGGLLSPPVSGLMARTKVWAVDVVIPVVHGTMGEDGTLQGLLELADIPYVGSGVLGSVVCMDKIVTKALLRENGLNVVQHTWFTGPEWEHNAPDIIRRIEEELSFPVFIKPANLGSSIGITKVQSREDVDEAVSLALSYDHRVLAERAVENAIEINCSVLDAEEPHASVCEQPLSWKQFLTFDEKYLRSAEAGMKGAERRIPAPISDELAQQIQEMAIKTFRVLGCGGIVRVDFLVSDANPGKAPAVYVNEVNTIPGSYSFYLWTASGIKPAELMDRLINLALETHRRGRKVVSSYSSGLLEKALTSETFGLKK